MNQTKRNIRLASRKVLSAVLAFVLAIGMCLPAVALSGAKEAWAQDYSSVRSTVISIIDDLNEEGFVGNLACQGSIYRNAGSVAEIMKRMGILTAEEASYYQDTNEGAAQLPYDIDKYLVEIPFDESNVGDFCLCGADFNNGFSIVAGRTDGSSDETPYFARPNEEGVWGLYAGGFHGRNADHDRYFTFVDVRTASVDPTPTTPADSYLCLESPDDILKGVEYDVFKLFDADVDENGVAKNIEGTSLVHDITYEDLSQMVASSSKRPSGAQDYDGALVVARATAEIGKPYQWGGAGPNGYDCSGLVSYALMGVYGQRVCTTATLMALDAVDDPQPGDICVNANTCGVYMGGGQMIAALSMGKPVQVGAVQTGMKFVRPAMNTSTGSTGDDTETTTTTLTTSPQSFQAMAYDAAGSMSANGTLLTEDTMGVSISMGMFSDYRSLLGKTVEITLGGNTVYATINDTHAPTNRAFDLQTAVYKALGFDSTSAFGMQTISIRLVDDGASAASVMALSDEPQSFTSAQQMAEFIAENIKDGDELYKDSFGMKLAKEIAANAADAASIKYAVMVEDEVDGNDFATNGDNPFTFTDAGVCVNADFMDKLCEMTGMTWEQLEGKTLTLKYGDEAITAPIKSWGGKGMGIVVSTATFNGQDIDDPTNPDEITFEGKVVEPDYDPADSTVITTVADEMCSKLSGTGYYLIVRKDTLSGEKSVASSPIFAAIHANENTIEIKAGIPAVDKLINEDSTDTWGKEADHSVNQNVPYQITGSVAENVDAYSTYKYVFHDEYEAARMSIVDGTVKVLVNGETEITPDILTDENGMLTVGFTDLYAAYPDLVKTDKIVLTYDAIQTGTAAPDGIVNTVYLEYANNPVNLESTGETVKSSCIDYSYVINFNKQDNSTGESLANAKFTIQNTAGKYIGIDEAGKIQEVDEAYEWTTDAEGYIKLDGIDIDSYTVVETQAPSDKYDMLDAPFTATLTVVDDNRNDVQMSTDGSDLVGIEVSAGEAVEPGIMLSSSYATEGVDHYNIYPLVYHKTDGSVKRTESTAEQAIATWETGKEWGFIGDPENFAQTEWYANEAELTASFVSKMSDQEQVNNFAFSTDGLGYSMSYSASDKFDPYVETWAQYKPGELIDDTDSEWVNFTQFNETMESMDVLLVPVDADNNAVKTADAVYLNYKRDVQISAEGNQNITVKQAGETSDNIATIIVKNIKKIELPSTGELGLRMLLIIAASIGAAAIIRRQMRKDDYQSVQVMTV